MQQRASSTWLDVVITHLGPRTARLLALGGPQPTQHHHSQPPLRVLHHLQYQEHHFTNLLTAATGGEPFPSTVRNRPTTGESRRTSSSSRGTSTPTTTTVAANATTSLFYSCRCPRRQRRIHERVLASDMLSRLWIWLPVLQRLPTPRASPWHSAPSHVSLFSCTYVMWLWTPAVATVRNAVLATHRGESVA